LPKNFLNFFYWNFFTGKFSPVFFLKKCDVMREKTQCPGFALAHVSVDAKRILPSEWLTKRAGDPGWVGWKSKER